MNKAELKRKCPHLWEVLCILSHDNDAEIPPTGYDTSLFSLVALEEEAARLSQEEKETIAAGEERAVNRLVLEKKVSELNRYLGFVFDLL